MSVGKKRTEPAQDGVTATVAGTAQKVTVWGRIMRNANASMLRNVVLFVGSNTIGNAAEPYPHGRYSLVRAA